MSKISRNTHVLGANYFFVHFILVTVIVDLEPIMEQLSVIQEGTQDVMPVLLRAPCTHTHIHTMHR